jgi:hypothetical protein
MFMNFWFFSHYSLQSIPHDPPNDPRLRALLSLLTPSASALLPPVCPPHANPVLPWVGMLAHADRVSGHPRRGSETLLCRYGLLFETHCEEIGSARTGSNQRFQVMSDTVHKSIIVWLEKHPDTTQTEKIRLELGYLTYTVMLLALCCDLMFRILI